MLWNLIWRLQAPKRSLIYLSSMFFVNNLDSTPHAAYTQLKFKRESHVMEWSVSRRCWSLWNAFVDFKKKFLYEFIIVKLTNQCPSLTMVYKWKISSLNWTRSKVITSFCALNGGCWCWMTSKAVSTMLAFSRYDENVVLFVNIRKKSLQLCFYVLYFNA